MKARALFRAACSLVIALAGAFAFLPLAAVAVELHTERSLYRNIVKKMFDERAAGQGQGHDTIRAA